MGSRYLKICSRLRLNMRIPTEKQQFPRLVMLSDMPCKEGCSVSSCFPSSNTFRRDPTVRKNVPCFQRSYGRACVESASNSSHTASSLLSDNAFQLSSGHWGIMALLVCMISVQLSSVWARFIEDIL